MYVWLRMHTFMACMHGFYVWLWSCGYVCMAVHGYTWLYMAVYDHTPLNNLITHGSIRVTKVLLSQLTIRTYRIPQWDGLLSWIVFCSSLFEKRDGNYLISIAWIVGFICRIARWFLWECLFASLLKLSPTGGRKLDERAISLRRVWSLYYD